MLVLYHSFPFLGISSFSAYDPQSSLSISLGHSQPDNLPVTLSDLMGKVLNDQPSHTSLTEGVSYDMAAIRVRILDGNGNPAPYAQLPVSFALSGDAELAGPSTVTAEGGMCGTYVRTLGTEGPASLTVHTGQAGDVTINFTIETGEEERWT